MTYTFTIESTGGNGIVVPGWGFLLNNELTDFNFDNPTHPNRPGRRQAAALVDRPDLRGARRRPFLAIGSPGGATIITTVLQILTERLDFGPHAAAGDRRPAREPAQPGRDGDEPELADGAGAGVPR